MTATLLVDAGDVCGEAPLWDAGRGTLFWLDLYRPTLHAFEAESGQHAAWPVAGPDLLACLVRAAGYALPLLVTRDAVGRIGTGTDGAVGFEPLRSFGHGSAREAFNDGKTHPSGVLWLGTADTREETPLGRVAAFPPGAAPVSAAGGLVVSNGPAFSPDGAAAYISDSVGQRILRVPVGPDGLPVGPPEPFAAFDADEGNPDGLTVDEDGFVWAAMWDGWGVRRLAPDGQRDDFVALPVPRPTACAFGGPDLRTLFVTSAAFGLDGAARPPGSGGLFAFDAGVGGRIEPVARI